MEFYLMKDQHIKFGAEGKVTFQIKRQDEVKGSTHALPLKLEPVLEPDRLDADARACEWHMKIKSIYDSLCIWEKNADVTSSFRAILHIALPLSRNPRDCIQLVNEKHKGTGFLRQLSSICGEDNLKVNLSVNIIQPEFFTGSFEDKELPIKALDNNLGPRFWKCEAYGCELELTFPLFLKKSPLYAHVTATLIMNDRAVAHFLRYFGNQKVKWSNRNKKLLEKGACSDLVIVGADGLEVKCHKAFLASQSEVFEAMFQSKMKEDSDGRLEMPDMSEAGIRAFLAVIYQWDFKEASASCNVAMEVLGAVHEYSIPDSVDTIASMICAKAMDWFNVNMAVELLLFAKKLPKTDKINDKLLTKAVTVIQFYAKTEPQRVRNSVEYQGMFVKYPQVALELTTLLLQYAGNYKALSFDGSE